MNKNLVKILVGIGLVGLGYGISKCKDLKVNIHKTKKPNEREKVDKSKGWGFFTKEFEEEVLDKEKYAQCECCNTCNRCNCREPMEKDIYMNENPYKMEGEGNYEEGMFVYTKNNGIFSDDEDELED